MTPAELIAAREAIGWTRRQTAIKAECSPSLLQAMEAGKVTIPKEIAEWLTKIAAVHATFPKPDSWRRQPGGPEPARSVPRVQPARERRVNRKQPLRDNV